MSLMIFSNCMRDSDYKFKKNMIIMVLSMLFLLLRLML